MTTPTTRKKVVILVHRIFTATGIKPGGIDYVTSFLENTGFEVIFIEHPLAGVHSSRIKNGEQIREYKIPFSGVIRWPIEIVFNIFKTLSYGKIDLIIAVDPLNFVSAYVVSLLRKTPVQFHAVDFSECRFEIKLLDAFYRKIYYFSIAHASFVTYVSKNMREIVQPRVKNPDRAVFLPNSPDYEHAARIDPKEKDRYELVYTKSNISDTEIDMLLDLTSLLKEKFPSIKLNVIGKASRRNLENIVILHGLVDYQTNIKIMSKSYIGVAWYENVKSFEKYADSLKIREYAASGLPVVCNRNISTAVEAYERGLLILCENVKELAEGLERLMSDTNLYSDMRDKALNWAKENDKSRLLNNLYRSVSLI
ncbi:MAG: glycosyltransferase family 4 protein [Patescibacteria group bacterium]